jgi:hypothetical protein
LEHLKTIKRSLRNLRQNDKRSFLHKQPWKSWRNEKATFIDYLTFNEYWTIINLGHNLALCEFLGYALRTPVTLHLGGNKDVKQGQ